MEIIPDPTFFIGACNSPDPDSISGKTTRDAGTLIPDEPDAWGVIKVDLDIGE